MARPPPPKLSSPPATALNANTSSTLPHVGPNFIPRKEFIPNHRIESTFCLLALSGHHYVRLYSFPAIVISALRRLFDQHNLITGFREDAQRHFYEFTLDGRPWANPKGIRAEKLIVDILAAVFYLGYAFLSTIDYGREADDRLVLAFSKPMILPYPAPSLSLSNASQVSLHQPIRSPFAISFASQTVMRVIGAPLPSTPAVLQAVRGAWPRGVLSDKKVGDATYEFKLKGYKWFHEDTFATDSLHHILGLLSALDHHGFTLLTSLSLLNRSRVKDLWIFTGLADDARPETPMTGGRDSSLELKRDLSHQIQAANSLAKQSIVPGHPPNSNARPLPSAPAPNDNTHHNRSVSDTSPLNSSPLKPKATAPPSSFMRAPFSLLRKPSPKGTMTIPESSEGSVVSPEQSPRIPPSVMDMTGIGSGLRRPSDDQRTPDVFYTTNGYKNSDTSTPAAFPFHTIPKASQMYPPPSILTTPNGRVAPGSRRSSLPVTPSSQTPLNRAPSAQPSPITPASSRQRRSSTPPAFSQALPPGIAIQAPSPIIASSSTQRKLLAGDNQHSSNSAERPREREIPVEAIRSPTPHLLNPGVFRDSALSYGPTERQSVEIPVKLAREDSRESHSHRTRDRGENGSGDRHDQRAPTLNNDEAHTRAPVRPEMDRASTEPHLPGAWSSSKREEHDVSNLPHSHSHSYPHSAHAHPPRPSLSKEHSSRESSDDIGKGVMSAMKKSGQPSPDRAEGFVPKMSPEKVSPRGEGIRKSERASVGVVSTPGSSSVGRSMKSNPASTTQSSKEHRGVPGRKDTASSGWVMVNVEGKEGKDGKSHSSKTVTQTYASTPSPPPSSGRPTPHGRSTSDSRIPGTKSTPSPRPYPESNAAVAPASMSAAAKAIVMIDAVEAREKEEKSSATSAFKRFLGRATGSPEPKNAKPPPTVLTRSMSTTKRKVAEPEQVEKVEMQMQSRIPPPSNTREERKRRGVPTTSPRKATDKRMSIN